MMKAILKAEDCLKRFGVYYNDEALYRARTRNERAKKTLNELIEKLPHDGNGYYIDCPIEIPTDYNLIWMSLKQLCSFIDTGTFDMIFDVYRYRCDHKDLSVLSKEESERLTALHFKGCNRGMKRTKFIYNAIEKYTKDFGEHSIDYLKVLYQRFADACNGVAITERFYIGTSFDEFCNMSNGNSWSSCHTPNGDYSHGITGYANDDCTAIVYKLNGNGDRLVTREVVHFVNDRIVFGRVYGDDTNVYYANKIMADVLAGLLGAEVVEDTASKKYIEYSCDYQGYNDLDHYTPDVKVLNGVYFKRSYIGAQSTCVVCGDRYDVGHDEMTGDCCQNEMVTCEECGDRVDEDDAVYLESVNGQYHRSGYYCEHHCFRCADCGEWHHEDEGIYVRSVGTVCHKCIDNYMICDECDDYHHADNITFTGDERNLCNACLTSDYTICIECDEYYPDDTMHFVKREYGVVATCESCRGVV